MKIFLTGGTGFVGRHLVERLLAEGHAVRALVRFPDQGNMRLTAFLSPRVLSDCKERLSFCAGDVVTGAGLSEAIQECEAVIHLVGIIMEKGANTFEAVHHMGTRHAVDAARRAGVKRYIQMSALGARMDGVAAYQTTKWKGEEEVRHSGIPYSILRPSLIFGPGDGFVTQMIDTMRKAPLFRPVPGPGTPQFRPVFIGDVAACFVRALTADAATNQTIDLGGADELSLNEVLAEIARCAGVRKPPVHIPMPLMLLGAAIAQTLLPNPPVTTDQLRMLREGSTCDITPMKQIFAIEPRDFSGCGRDSQAAF